MANNSCDTNQTIWDLTHATDLSGLVFTSREWILYQIMLPSFIVFGICTNVSFIWTVINTPSLHTSTYRYLVNLSISDLLFLIINYISQIIHYHTSPLKNSVPIIVTTSSYMLLICSLGTVTLVSLERFLAICYPIKHHLIKGTRRTNTLICSVWSISFCYALPTLSFGDTLIICIIWPDDSAFTNYPNQFTAYVQINNWTFDFIQSTTFVLCLFFMIFNNVLYFKIYFALKRRNNNDLGLNSTSDSQHRQVAIMLIVNGIFFFICVSFMIFATPVFLIYKYVTNDYNTLFILIWRILNNILFGLNACMNPILYLITNRRYRNAFVTVFTWSRNNSQGRTEVNTIKLFNISRI